MATAIDHLVIAVPDPDAAAAELTGRLGLAFTGGGRHPGLGTFNRLAFCGDAYLELIGVEDAAAAQGWAVGRAAVRVLEQGGGFATWAVSDDEIDATVARLRASGSRIGEPVHGRRLGADGEPVEWWTAALPELGPDRPPFLIRHLPVGAEWSAAALARRRRQVHPIGTTLRLERLEIGVEDAGELAEACRAELGMRFRRAGGEATWKAGGHRVRLRRWADLPLPTIALLAPGLRDRRSLEAFGVRFAVTDRRDTV